MGNDFLSPAGQAIYDDLMRHCKDKLKMMDIDVYELSMLANSFANYARCARVVNEDENFGAKQIRPEYVVMKTEYQNILKHSGKFGLNPADRAKIFKGVEEKKKKGLEAKMGK